MPRAVVWAQSANVVGIPFGSNQFGNYPDGFSGAPAGVIAPYPTLLNQYGGLNSRNPGLIGGVQYQPPWHVAGIDYGVGYPNGQVFKNPLVDPLPSGATVDNTNHFIRCNSNNNLVFDGWDFSLNNQYTLYLNGTTSNTTIRNCKFGVGSNNGQLIQCDFNAGNYYLGYCYLAGGGTSFSGGGISTGNSGGATIEYCWFTNAQGDHIDPRAGPIILRYSLFDSMMFNASAHSDCLQMIQAQTNVQVYFSTFYQPAAAVTGWPGSATSFIKPETPNNGTTTGLVINNNTMIAIGATGHNPANGVAVSYLMELTAAAASNSFITGPQIFQNFTDFSGAFGVFYPNSIDGVTGSIVNGNINMINGSTVPNIYS